MRTNNIKAKGRAARAHCEDGGARAQARHGYRYRYRHRYRHRHRYMHGHMHMHMHGQRETRAVVTCSNLKLIKKNALVAIMAKG